MNFRVVSIIVLLFLIDVGTSFGLQNGYILNAQTNAKTFSNEGVEIMSDIRSHSISAKSSLNTSSVPTPPPVEPVSRLSTPPPTPPRPVTMSMHSVTVTMPPVPSAATATAQPDTDKLTKITHLLFAILLVVTAILLVMVGACMVDLRKRYLGIPKPCYNQLKSVTV